MIKELVIKMFGKLENGERKATAEEVIKITEGINPCLSFFILENLKPVSVEDWEMAVELVKTMEQLVPKVVDDLIKK